MTLELAKLTDQLAQMAQTTARAHVLRRARLDEALATLRAHRTAWTAVAQALALAEEKADRKVYRSARPFDAQEPLDAAISPAVPPSRATLIATDGSQIMPDRHAAYLYYLINIGGIVYHHGSSQAPHTFSFPRLVYPQDEAALDAFNSRSGAVSIERDMGEIAELARQAQQHRQEGAPLLAVLDQRLLYWPIGSTGVADNAAVTEWGGYMTAIRQAGALLCGYIDRPGANAVLTLLKSLTAVADPTFVWHTLGSHAATRGLTDRDLFAEFLQPGQRSKLFVNISPPNETFARQDAANEVCFFYLHAGQGIARVDIPRWVAEDEKTVTAVHALLVDQCRILGDYPYILARADEIAVVGHRDHEELEFAIELQMQKQGVRSAPTAKQGGKNLARGGKQRFTGG